MSSDLLNRLMALFAFVVLAGFLGILFGFVSRWDLGIMVLITLVLAAWDFWQTASGRKENTH